MVPDISLRGGVSRPVFGIGTSFFFFVCPGSKCCEVLGLAWLGFCIISSIPFFLA